MSLEIRCGDVERDQTVLLDLFRAHLNPRYDAARYDWLYRRNPAGPPRIWLAVDTASDAVIGTSTAFPRALTVDGHAARGWVLGDFCVAATHRSLGPAVKLQRAALAEVDAGAIPFCYDFPSGHMTAVYARLGRPVTLTIPRFARALSVGPHVRRHVRPPALASGVTAIGNLALRLGSRRPAPSGVTVAVAHERCGEEFSALAREVAHSGVAVERSAAYVNWRWLDNPIRPHELIVVRRRGAVRGWAVMVADGGHAALVDGLTPEPDAIVPALVEEAVQRARAHGAATLSVSLVEQHPWLPALRDRGFRAREATPVVAHGASAPNRPWLLMSGDADS